MINTRAHNMHITKELCKYIEEISLNKHSTNKAIDKCRKMAKRTIISTGYSIKPEHWNTKRVWIKKVCPNFEEIDSVLTKITSKLGNILTFAKDNDLEPTIEFILLELEKDRNSIALPLFILELGPFFNCYLHPVEELMKISGHKSPATFMRYIKVDNMQAADRLKKLRKKIQR